jgi:hypothetical protein
VHLGAVEVRAGRGGRGGGVVAAPIRVPRVGGEVLWAGVRLRDGVVVGVDCSRGVGDGGGLERAAKPLGLWDVMWERVDRVFADLVGGEYPAVCGEGAGPEDAA